MNNIKLIYMFVGLAVVAGLLFTLMSEPAADGSILLSDDVVACTEEAKMCPNGSAVGRTGPDCSFAECPLPEVSPEITVASVSVGDMIISPLLLEGEAVGPWYFEATMPVEIWDWTGATIATGFVTATSDWMTVDMVPFTGSVTYVSPYSLGDSIAEQQGSLVFKKANPSGEPVNDDELVIPILFTP